MPETRRLVLILSSAVGLWTLSSFAGAMFNPANAAFWSGSLMWSLLAILLVAPALLMIHHASSTGEAQRPASKTEKAETPAEEAPFVDEEGHPTLWPQPSPKSSEPTAEEEWPQNRTNVPA